MKEKLRTAVQFVWDVIKAYFDDNGSRMAAALAFYTLFSMAPLVIIATAIAGLFVGDELARAEAIGSLEQLAGRGARDYAVELVEQWSDRGSGILATIVGVGALLYGSYRVFGALRDTLNMFWGVRPRSDLRWTRKAANEVLSLSMVLLVGGLLLASLAASTVLSGAAEFVGEFLSAPVAVWNALDFTASFVLVTLLFAFIFKVLPDVQTDWRDIWLGAALTSLLFTVGKLLLGYYLGHESTTSVFGAAGSLVALLFWVYYSAQILFFGAKFTQFYAMRYGNGMRPEKGAVRVERVVPDGAENESTSDDSQSMSR